MSNVAALEENAYAVEHVDADDLVEAQRWCEKPRECGLALQPGGGRHVRERRRSGARLTATVNAPARLEGHLDGAVVRHEPRENRLTRRDRHVVTKASPPEAGGQSPP